MTKVCLVAGKDVPCCCHVARYCRDIRTRSSGSRRIIKRRAFIRGRDKTSNVSFSVMENFSGENDDDVLRQVCEYRGNLSVDASGYYIVMNVGKIRLNLPDHRLRFKPTTRNPAHATLYSNNLVVSTELASLANSEGGSKLLPVPNPIPNRKS